MSETMTVEEQRELLEQALFEIKRVIAGQDAMLERVLVCLLAGGHLLIEGVPGLAKTLTIKTTAQVLGGSFQRVQFTPDLVPSDLVGTRMYRPDSGSFDTELGPVFCNFLLADEINRAPAKVQSALLEVMQEHQVTIGHDTHLVPEPFLVMATQNPIESEGTYPLPEAQVDRFMLKILVGYPEHDEELTVVQRSLTAAPQLRQVLELERLRDLQNAGSRRLRRSGHRQLHGAAGDRDARAGQVRAGRHGALHLLRRQPARPDQPRPVGEGARVHPRPRLRRRAGRRVAREGRAPAPARAQLPGPRRAGGRRQDPRRGDREGDRAGARPEQAGDRSLTIAPETTEFARRPDRPGPGALPETLLRALDLTIGRRIEGMLAGDHRSSVLGAGSELAQVRPYIPGDDVRRIEWNVTARTGETHVRIDLAERVLVTWLALDVSASMSFGTAERRKADVAEGVALALGHLASRRGNRLGLVGFGDERSQVIPPRAGRAGMLGLLLSLRREPVLEGGGATSLGAALGLVSRMARQRSLVAIVSDFRGPRDWRLPLLQLAGGHDVLAVEIRDPREETLPNVGELRLVDPETGRQLRVDTASTRLRERFKAAAAAERAEVAHELTSLGVGHVVLSTEGDWLRPFALHLRRRGGRR